MPVVERILTDALIEMRDPVYPTRRELLLHLFKHNQMFVNDLRMTDEGWLLRHFAFDPDGSTNIYPVPAGALGFAGSYLVHTDPAQYSDYRRREVLVVRKIDLNLTGAPSRVIAGGQSEPDEVVAMAFSGSESGWTVEVLPFNAAGHYTCWFEPGYIGETSILNQPAMLESFTPLLTISVALDGLSTAEWAGLDEAANAARRASIQPRLINLEARFLDKWKNYIASLNQPQLTQRAIFESAPGMGNRTRGGRRFPR